MQVYLIQNTANLKRYVGQHSGDDLEWYLRKNISEALRGGTCKNFLYNAFRKHGADAFTIRCVCTCTSKEEMDVAEKAFIVFYKTRDSEWGYNLTDGGGGLLGVRHSAETKAKMRVSSLGNQRCVGRVMSDATREKIRAKAMGNQRCVGRKYSAETLAKKSESGKNRTHSLETRQKMSELSRARVNTPDGYAKLAKARESRGNI